MASGTKVTEIDQISSLAGVNDVYIQKDGGFYRIPLATFFAELIDARTDAQGDAYESVGEYLRALEQMTPDVDLSKLDLFIDDGKLYLYDKDAEETIGDGVTLPSGGGGSDYGSVLRITRVTASAITILNTAGTCPLEYSWVSTDSETEDATGPGSEIWTVGSTVVHRRTVQQGSNSIDLFQYLSSGENAVKLTIEDGYGNSRSIPFNVTVSSFGLSWNLEDMELHGRSEVTVRLVPTGDGTKTLKVSLDGTTILSQEVTTTGRTVSTTISAQTHGAHTILAWVEATVNGETISTVPLRHVGVWTASGTTTPIVAIYDPTPSMQQFATSIFKYMVINPAADTADVTLKQGDTTVNTLTVDRTMQSWSYRAATTGTITLSIVCGAVTGTITLTVSSSGYNIQPVTNGLVLDVDPSGHSNSEANRSQFGYKDGSNVNHPFTFSQDFDWVNGGFRQDENGVTAFVIRRGSYVTFDMSFFNDDATQSGKEIKMIFKAVNVGSDSAELLTCKANGIGLKLTATDATFSSELQSASAKYCTDEQIELDLNIEAGSENRLAVLSLKGIPSRFFAYTAGDNWEQATPELVKIGSTDADVWIYRIKMYGNSLTRYEILDNYVADCTDADEMVSRFLRNDIFASNGSISLTKLAEASPTLRIIHIWANKMTTAKDDEVTCKVELIYSQGGADFYFMAEGVTMKAQGTSSLEYILAALNLDLDFKNATSWVDGNGSAKTGYAMTAGAIPVNYLNVKLNIASSENANNVILADDYNTYQPNITKMRDDNAAVRDTVQGVPCAVFFTNTAETAITVGARTVAAGDTILYGCGDLNNSKKNFAVFGQTSDYPGVLCVEIGNNNNPQTRFKSDDLSTETWDGKPSSNFEFRYPKSPTAADKAAWQALLSWVVSTDRSAATGDALAESVTYDGVTYTTDSADYRAAKFKAELADHFNVDSLLYHYLFTERHCMVDNRAKNCFVSYEPDPNGVWRWNMNKNYDDDTAEGTDNSGGLTFRYGMEDTDTVGASNVFNAADSVLWVNLRDLFAAELAAMFRNRESAGAWDVSRILTKFKNYQAARPEALCTEDMFEKYFSAYLSSQEERYMAQMLGTKEYQRRHFEEHQGPYCSSKYRGSVATADRISLRLNAPDTYSGVAPCGDIVDVVPASDIYLRVQYGNAGEVVTRAKAGQTYTLEMPSGIALNDLETYIYSASAIKSIGSMAGLYTKFADISSATRLRQLILGSSETGYENTGMTAANGGVSLGATSLLEKVDLRGTPELTKPLDLSSLGYLKEVYLTNSGITGVTFAPGALLETAHLGAPASLVARNLAKLTTFSMSGTNLTSLWVEDCSAIDTMTLCNDAENLARGRLIGVNWSLQKASLLLRLMHLAGIDESGNNTANFVLTGTAYVASISQIEYDAIVAAFPGLTVTHDEFAPSYTVTFVNYDGTVLDTQYVTQYGSATDPILNGTITTPQKPPSTTEVYTFSAWDTGFGYITDDTVVTAFYTASTRQYTVRWWNGTELLQQSTVDVHTAATYTGAAPTRTSTEIFVGFDAEPSDVVSDMNINAVYETTSVPAQVTSAYDYLYSDNPNDNSAYTFGEFIGIINAGLAQTYFLPGEKIKMDTSGVSYFTDNTIVFTVHGFDHFKHSGESTFAKVVFGMLGYMDTSRAMHSSASNTGGFAATTLHTWLNTMYTKLPLKWRSVMSLVEVRTSKGAQTTQIVTTDEHVFLFSQSEVGLGTGSPYGDEVDSGAARKVFNVYTNDVTRVKKKTNGTGSTAHWWLRSPLSSSPSNFCVVGNAGNAGSYSATSSNAVVWGFCIG